MATTYDVAVLDSTTAGKRNQVRFLSQDNRSGKMRVQDEEITYVLGEEPNVYYAAARVAELVVARLADGASSKSVGGLSISWGAGGESNHYRALAATLRARGSTHQTPTAGGISVADKDSLEADTDRPLADVTRGAHDNPAATALRPEETGRFS
mgnify:CR=1 FL=1